jgi:hypothetical protein
MSFKFSGIPGIPYGTDRFCVVGRDPCRKGRAWGWIAFMAAPTCPSCCENRDHGDPRNSGFLLGMWSISIIVFRLGPDGFERIGRRGIGGQAGAQRVPKPRDLRGVHVSLPESEVPALQNPASAIAEGDARFARADDDELDPASGRLDSGQKVPQPFAEGQSTPPRRVSVIPAISAAIVRVRTSISLTIAAVSTVVV